MTAFRLSVATRVVLDPRAFALCGIALRQPAIRAAHPDESQLLAILESSAPRMLIAHVGSARIALPLAPPVVHPLPWAREPEAELHCVSVSVGGLQIKSIELGLNCQSIESARLCVFAEAQSWPWLFHPFAPASRHQCSQDAMMNLTSNLVF